MILLIQEKNRNIKCFLMDPPGSGLFNKVTRGVMYTKEEAEGKRLKNPFDTITEGIGINRITKNFMMAELDGAYRGTDREAVEMSRYTLTVEILLCLSVVIFNNNQHTKFCYVYFLTYCLRSTNTYVAPIRPATGVSVSDTLTDTDTPRIRIWEVSRK